MFKLPTIFQNFFRKDEEKKKQEELRRKAEEFNQGAFKLPVDTTAPQFSAPTAEPSATFATPKPVVIKPKEVVTDRPKTIKDMFTRYEQIQEEKTKAEAKVKQTFLGPVLKMPVTTEEGFFSALPAPKITLEEAATSLWGGKFGKSLVKDISAAMGATMPMGLNPVSTAALFNNLNLYPELFKAPGVMNYIASSLKTGSKFVVASVLFKLLSGEKVEPNELYKSFGMGAFFGIIATGPQPMTGIPPTELKAARLRLEKYGIKLEDYNNPATLKSKFIKTAYKIHPDKTGGSSAEMAQFNNDWEIVTSTRPPAVNLSSVEIWARNLWTRATTKASERALVPVPGQPVAQPPQVPLPPIVPPVAPAQAPEFVGGKAAVPAVVPEVKLVAPMDLTKAIDTKEFGFQGLKEITTEIPVEDIPKRSITTPEYRDEKVVAMAGRRVTKPIVATIKDITDPNSPIEIVNGWHRVRQAIANKDKTIPVKFIFKPIQPPTGGVGGVPLAQSAQEAVSKGISKEEWIKGQHELNIKDLVLDKGMLEKINRPSLSPNEPIRVAIRLDEKDNKIIRVLDGHHRIKQAIDNGEKTIKVIFDGEYTRSQLSSLYDEAAKPQTTKGVGGVIPPRTTVAQLEKQGVERRFTSYLSQAKTQPEYVARVGEVSKQLDLPAIKSNRSQLRQIRALANKQIASTTGYEMTGNWKGDYAMLQTLKDDPELKDAVSALEDIVIKVDKLAGNRAKKEIEISRQDMNLPAEGKFYIPYGKYTTHGTGNREWVQTNIPLIHMGNKRQMVGYILNALNIKQTDLPSIVSSDVTHLAKYKHVYDLFGGSGLLSNLSKKFFPGAKITYNELDASTLRAIERTKVKPKEISRFASEIALYLTKNPKADWLAHFATVYKEDPDFLVAAKLIEATAGRTGEVTTGKLQNLIEAIPNFAKTFAGVEVTNKDAWGMLDELVKHGSPSDIVFLDPPYLWSPGYNVGQEMERTEGFLKIVDYVKKLDDKGVRVIFFNNDPEVQVKDAGLEQIHLGNIMGKLNQVSEDMMVVRGIKPIGTARREIMITNLPEAKKSLRFLVLSEVENTIAKLRDDPAAAPREVLKLLRDIRGTSQFAPEGERITPQQVRTIKLLRKRLHIKNREMIPVLDELLGDTSFAKMTKEDGIKLLGWLKPQNFAVIENKIALTREMLAEEKRQLATGELLNWKDEELEKKIRGIDAVNKTISDIERFGNVMRRLPEAKQISGLRKLIGAKIGYFLPQDISNDILGIYHQFQIPMISVVNIPETYTRNLSRVWDDIFKSLSKEEGVQLLYIQSGAEKYYKGTITAKARQYSKYFQELMDGDYTIKNRLSEAGREKPLAKRTPYIAWVLDHNLKMAMEMKGERVSFWEKRMKTPKDYAAGLFSKDPNRIKEAFLTSTNSWMRKMLYKSFLQPRIDKLFDVSDPSGLYAKMVVDAEVFSILPANERLARSASLDDSIKTIAYKRIKVNPELVESLNNSLISSKIKIEKDGTIKVPRLQLAGVDHNILPLVYAAKLGGLNFSYIALQLAQTASAFPLTGFRGGLKSLVDTLNLAMPQNEAQRKNLAKYMEMAGYEFASQIGGYKYSPPKNKVLNIAWRVWNYTSLQTDLIPRKSAYFGGIGFLEKMEKVSKFKFDLEDKQRFGAAFSALTNFIGGPGHAAMITKKSLVGKLSYVFMTWPMRQFHLITKYSRMILDEPRFSEFIAEIGDAGLLSDEAFEAMKKYSPKVRVKLAQGMLRLLFLLSAGVALLYGMTKNWNVASRGLINLEIQQQMFVEFILAVGSWAGNPNDDNADRVKSAWRNIASISTIRRIADVLSIYNYGFITTGAGRPLFVEKNLRNYFLVGGFGRSALEEYEKAYPSWLARTLGGRKEAGEVARLQEERTKIRAEETKTAIELLKTIQSNISTDQLVSKIVKLKQSGKLTDAVKEKLKGYLEEYGRGQGPLERSIVGLKDEDQAKFILDKINSPMSSEELVKLLVKYRQQEILTDNVKDEMRRLLKEGYQTQKGFLGF